MFSYLREKNPVFWHEEPNGPGFWNVVRFDDLVEVNRNAETFSSEIGGISISDPHEHEEGSGGFDMRGTLMLYTDPPKHTRYRKLVNRGFTPRMIGLLENYLQYRTILIVDQVIEKGECDFVVDVAAELPLQAIAEIMGVPQEERKKLFEWSNKMIGIEDPEYAGDDNQAAAIELYMYANELASERKKDPKDDLITRLINAEILDDNGEPTVLNEFEIDGFMLLMSVAGNETTRNATSQGLWGLLDHPKQFDLLKENRSELMDTAVDEIVRYASPVMHFRRTASSDTEIAGQKIRKGEKVVMWHISANRDDSEFRDPFSLDISRSPNNHVGFGGGGPHFCLGANLAKMELRIIFDEICRRMPDIALTEEPSRLRSNFINGVKHMPVSFTPSEKVRPAGISV
tara:strand:- start:784 stop:1986 length:1203 start_codon:yes stop_codon:yes gene_type:complete